LCPGAVPRLPSALRPAARSLARAPLFSLVAVVSIALGIGANTAVFTLLDQVALRPLPVEPPDELAQLHARGGTYGDGTGLWWPMFRGLQARGPRLAGVIARFFAQMHVSVEGASERTDG